MSTTRKQNKASTRKLVSRKDKLELPSFDNFNINSIENNQTQDPDIKDAIIERLKNDDSEDQTECKNEPVQSVEDQKSESKQVESTTDDPENKADSQADRELNKVYVDHRGRFVYKTAYGKRLKSDGTYAPYVYKRKYYFKDKPRGPAKGENKINLRRLLKRLKDNQCAVVINFINTNILNDAGVETSSNTSTETQAEQTSIQPVLE